MKVSCFQMKLDFILDMFGVVTEHSIKMSVLSKLTDGKVDMSLFGRSQLSPQNTDDMLRRVIIAQFGAHPDLHTLQQDNARAHRNGLRYLLTFFQSSILWDELG